MIKIIDNKIYRDSEKIGWIDGSHVRDESGAKLGYFDSTFIYNEAGHKVAYVHENQLMFENEGSPQSLEGMNEKIQGTYPLLTKCAVWVLLEE